MYKSVDDILEAVWSVVEFSNYTERPKINDFGFLGNSPLGVVIVWGDLDAVKLLVQAGADINAVQEFGDTPLHAAIEGGKFDIARYLIKLGADQTAKNDEGKLPKDCCWEGEWEGLGLK